MCVNRPWRFSLGVRSGLRCWIKEYLERFLGVVGLDGSLHSQSDSALFQSSLACGGMCV